MNTRSVGTHDGPFHADEVTACALLLLFDQIDRDKIHRTRDRSVIDKCEYVCDVGGIYDPSKKRFDHHQVDYVGKLSSAGMILEYLNKEKIIEDNLFEHINKSLVIGVDAVDNGHVSQPLGHCSYSGVISNFVPPTYDATVDEFNAAFFAALDFASGHLSRLLTRYAYAQSCKGKVKQAMQEGKEVLYFDEAMPWMDAFFEFGGDDHPAQFLIMPAGKH
ncbi:MAG: MYG1 family protein, partial [Simkaniaceae bacterium]|nr:MYG1 family protein [Simkaniaceae bacterium]